MTFATCISLAVSMSTGTDFPFEYICSRVCFYVLTAENIRTYMLNVIFFCSVLENILKILKSWKVKYPLQKACLRWVFCFP